MAFALMFRHHHLGTRRTEDVEDDEGEVVSLANNSATKEPERMTLLV